MNGVISRTNEAQGKSCCDIVKVNSSDELASYLSNKLTAGDYVIFTVKDGVEGKTIEISLNTASLSGVVASPNDKVKAHSSDPNAAGYLYDKLTDNPTGTILVKKNGTNSLVYFDIELDVTELNDVVSSGLGNGGILVYDNASEKWVCSYALEGTFTGTTSKVPSSSAIKTKLQALYLTDADNLGSTGNSIMNEVKDIEPSRILCVYESDATASNIIDTSYPKTSTMIAVTPVVGDNGDGGFQSFGGFTIQTNESPAMDDPNYTAGLVRFTLDEYYSSATPLGVEDSIYLDLMLRLPANGVALSEMKVKISPYYIKDGTADFATFYAPQTKTIQWDGTGADVCNWYTWTFSGMTASTKPIPLAFFITIQSEDGAFTATYTGVNTVEIVALRARYKKPVIGLNGSSVVI